MMLVPDGKQLDLFAVNLLTGVFFYVKTDLYVPDVMPLAFTRTYYPPDDWARKFQVQLPHVYDPCFTGSRWPYTFANWDLPDRHRVHFDRISPGTGYADAVFEHASPTPVFERSRLAWNGDGWDLNLADGTTYLSPEAYHAARPQQGSLVAIFDRDGNEVRLLRKPNGDLFEIRSPEGRSIRLDYDDKGRIVRAKDSSGNAVAYDYDSNDRLETVRYSQGQTTKYRYDPSDRVVKVEDSSGLTLGNKYDPRGAILEQTVGGRSFDFRYIPDERPRSAHVDIIDGNGEVARVRIEFTDEGSYAGHYTVERLTRVSRR